MFLFVACGMWQTRDTMQPAAVITAPVPPVVAAKDKKTAAAATGGVMTAAAVQVSLDVEDCRDTLGPL